MNGLNHIKNVAQDHPDLLLRDVTWGAPAPLGWAQVAQGSWRSTF
jgi:hypothetical protein